MIADPQVGLLLTCNVTVEEVAPGETMVSIIKPTEMLSLEKISENNKIAELADEAEKRLLIVASKLFS